MKVAQELAHKAKALDICKPWYKEILSLKEKTALVQIYIRGIDFCLSNNYPGNGYIEKHFKGVMEPLGVHLDECLCLNNKRLVVALGHCTGCINLDMYNVSEIYIKDTTDIRIIVQDNTFAMIDIFDETRLHIEASGNAKVCINRYEGGTISIDKKDNAIVKLIEMYKKTY